MEYRALGRTKLKVSVIGLGGGPFLPDNMINLLTVRKTLRLFDTSFNSLGGNYFLSNKFDIATLGDIIKTSYNQGINLIETGWEYNEPRIGQAISQIIDEKRRLYIAAKSTASDQESMQKSVNQSLLNLNREYLDIYQLHFVKDLKDLKLKLKRRVLKVLKKEKQQGKIGFIGITGHHIPTLIKAVKTNEFDTVQVPYNIAHVLAEELFDVCQDYDVGTMVMKPLEGGFLIPPKTRSRTPSELKNIGAENALRFILSNKKVHTAIVGMTKPKQVEENTKTCSKNLTLPEKQRRLMSRNVQKFFSEEYCRVCRYCMPCAVNGISFRIDTCLKLYELYKKYGGQQFKLEYSQQKIKADACKSCGICEKKCPYNLPIMALLKRAHKELDMKISFFTKTRTFLNNLKLITKSM
jgi:predicted aldo/keto reductase-like oxidoreductase